MRRRTVRSARPALPAPVRDLYQLRSAVHHHPRVAVRPRRPPPCRHSPCASDAPPNTTIRRIADSTRSRSPAPIAGRRCGSGRSRPGGLTDPMPRWRPPNGRWQPARWSPSRESAATTWPAPSTTTRRSRALRARKARGAKPFAMLVRDLDVARRYADVDDAEAAVLSSPARPIVLLRRRPRRAGRRRRRARQPAARADAAVLPHPSPAAGGRARRRRPGSRCAGADQRQPLRRAHLLHR